MSRPVITRRRRARLVVKWVQTERLQQQAVTIEDIAYSAGRLQGMSDALEALLIDRERGADWAEFNAIADEINWASDVMRKHHE